MLFYFTIITRWRLLHLSTSCPTCEITSFTLIYAINISLIGFRIWMKCALCRLPIASGALDKELLYMHLVLMEWVKSKQLSFFCWIAQVMNLKCYLVVDVISVQLSYVICSICSTAWFLELQIYVMNICVICSLRKLSHRRIRLPCSSNNLHSVSLPVFSLLFISNCCQI